MSKGIALVTGASSGLGEAITRQIEKDNFYVLATGRRMQELEKLRSANVEPFMLDVTKSEDVKAAIDYLCKTKGGIDLVVNSAGYGYYSTIEEGSVEDVQRLFDVNYFGTMRVIQEVLPHMRKRQGGTIINISSVVGQVALPAQGYYCSTKHAIEAFSDSLRMEVKQFGIKVVIIEPGPIKTGFDKIALDSLKKSHKIKDYNKLVSAMGKSVVEAYADAIDPSSIAHAVHKILSTKNPKRRYVVGGSAKLMIFIKNKLGDVVLDPMLYRALKL